MICGVQSLHSMSASQLLYVIHAYAVSAQCLYDAFIPWHGLDLYWIAARQRLSGTTRQSLSQ
jgi:hypothetical protein